MDEAMVKSLSDLIDETLQEIEELKKSSKMHAEELDLSEKGPGESLNAQSAGEEKSVQGGGAGLKKEEEKEESEEHEEEEESEEHEEESDEEEKEEHKKKMPEGMKKEEMEKEEHVYKEEGKTQLPSKMKKPRPVAVLHPDVAHLKKEEEEAKGKDYHGLFKKSEEQLATLTKSIDERFAPMEEKINSLFEMVNKIASSPVAARGVTARSIVPLQKSEDAPAPLSKDQVTEKLFEMKKSGVSVPAEDFVKIDLGSDLSEIVKKYNLK
jgi:hypothetical protein